MSLVRKLLAKTPSPPPPPPPPPPPSLDFSEPDNSMYIPSR